LGYVLEADHRGVPTSFEGTLRISKECHMPRLHPITPCLWFDDQAEQAAMFYTSIFPNSKIGRITRYGTEGHEIHGRAPGAVMTVDFQLDGHAFTALNGGPMFKFNEAISFQVPCDSQAQADDYWEKLSEGGDPAAQQCGWLKDKFGVSWQVFPAALIDLVSDPDSPASQRAMNAMLKMKRIDIDALRQAYEG
jgi:predicted 3-demethylubiquinone-9 3-methyltransferase (glyoxalase superfamily)